MSKMKIEVINIINEGKSWYFKKINRKNFQLKLSMDEENIMEIQYFVN